MIEAYLGHLPQADPLYGYLRDQIMPQLGVHSAHPVFRVFAFSFSRGVYLYQEKHSGVRVAGKFQPPPGPSGRVNVFSVENEYRNLVFLRSLGLDRPPHTVVRPLGFSAGCGNVLLTEFVEGEPLDSVIRSAMHQGRRDRLYRKLTALAHFLATLHNRTAGDWGVNFDHSSAYMTRLIGSLVTKRGMGRDHTDELYRLRDAWRANPASWEDRAVLTHGDATPSNFLFGRGRDVMAIDLERMQWADRVFDLGRLCGELCHFFFQGQNSPEAAEPFIGHFLWEYSCHFPDRQSAFRAVCRRVPFYMGITLLRIARNAWIDAHYRWRLIARAKTILRALP